MVEASHYTYRVSWSASDKEFVATCAEFGSLSWLAEDHNEALNGIIAVVKEVVADLEASGEPIPAPLGDRHYSGRFLLRIPPELHQALVLLATEQGVSLNRLVSERLSRTTPSESPRLVSATQFEAMMTADQGEQPVDA